MRFGTRLIIDYCHFIFFLVSWHSDFRVNSLRLTFALDQ